MTATCYKIKSGGEVHPKYGPVNWLCCKFELGEERQTVELYPTTRDASAIAEDVLSALKKRHGWEVTDQARSDLVSMLSDEMEEGFAILQVGAA